MVLGKTLESPWTARRSNQSILEEISPGCSLEGMMLKLKLQYFGHLMRRADSLEKILMLGGIGGRRRRGRQDEMAGWHYGLDGHEFKWTPVDGEGQGGLVCCDSWGRKESDMTEQLNWTDGARLLWTLTCDSNVTYTDYSLNFFPSNWILVPLPCAVTQDCLGVFYQFSINFFWCP